MKIVVTREPGIGYVFEVRTEKDYDKVADVIEACLKLERELLLPEEPGEKEDK